VARFWIAGCSAVLGIVYTLVLATQLRPLKDELPDCIVHALGCVAGLVIVIVQLFVVQGVSPTEILSVQQLDGTTDTAAGPLVAIAIAIEAIVLLHFIFTSGELCMNSIFKANDPEILKHYHDEYALLAGSFKLKAESM